MHFFDKEQEFFWWPCDCRWPRSFGGGVGMGGEVSQAGSCDALLLWRWGDESGVFPRALNLAGLIKLPCIFMVENNGYGMGTHVHRASAVTELKLRTEDAYGIPGKEVDGMDCIAMYQMSRRAIEYCRAGYRLAFPRSKNLPLPRALDVRPAEIPHQGGSRPTIRSTTRSAASKNCCTKKTCSMMRRSRRLTIKSTTGGQSPRRSRRGAVSNPRGHLAMFTPTRFRRTFRDNAELAIYDL